MTIFSLLHSELPLRISVESFNIWNAQSAVWLQAPFIGCEAGEVYSYWTKFPCVPSSLRKFDLVKGLISPETIKNYIYLLYFPEILMRKIRRKDTAMCIYSMINQDLSPLLLFLKPIPFPLIVWQLSQLYGAYPLELEHRFLLWALGRKME